MEAVIQAVKNGEDVECASIGGSGSAATWSKVNPASFVGNFLECHYRCIRKPRELYLMPRNYGMYISVTEAHPAGTLYREVIK